MSDSKQEPSRHSGKRSSGPQGTRFFSTEALRQYASDAANGRDSEVSTRTPVLEGSSPGIEGRRFVIRPGRQAIGRRLDNDIVVDDLSVSGCHAWITQQHGRCIIMNTLSTNGTFVNDRRIHEVALRHGDHIRLGQAEFVFLTREHGQPRHSYGRWIGGAVALLLVAGAVAWWWLRSP
ncbi:FHA domain-containing protein [Rhodanobacter sp. FW102-FHT14D06]|jgi:pSer/pThr/pTyr-binding forkhead associated (FHA) protein|uniref:FHA domain-containing protein n=2 Tax=unclassified Rhodanobacter TaxID=2621553 RepID=A0AB74UQQ2_9GAMM